MPDEVAKDQPQKCPIEGNQQTPVTMPEGTKKMKKLIDIEAMTEDFDNLKLPLPLPQAQPPVKEPAGVTLNYETE